MADLDPEMRGGGGHKKFFFRPQFGLKISGVRGALGPLAPPLDP